MTTSWPMNKTLQVYKDRDGMMGIVDFAYEDDMRYAIKKLDDTEFERGCIVNVSEDTQGTPPRDRSVSRSRRSASRSRSRGRSISRSRSPVGSRSPRYRNAPLEYFPLPKSCL